MIINGDSRCSFWQPVQADSQPKLSDLVLGRRPLGAILQSSNEPGELSQWLCHDDSTINIVVIIIIIIELHAYAPMRDKFFTLIYRGAQSHICIKYDHPLPPSPSHGGHILSHLTNSVTSLGLCRICRMLKHYALK